MNSEPDRIEFELSGGARTQIAVRTHPRARRISVRMDTRTGQPVLTLPPGMSVNRALPFLHRQRDWLTERCNQNSPRVPLVHGAVIPLRGEPFELLFVEGPRKVWSIDGRLSVGGPPDMAPSRVTKWLKAQAKEDLIARAKLHAAGYQRDIAAITVRDTVSRWGSCSSSRKLSFSWRLIFAPPAVLDYVAAHEAAHLVEMNHTDRFWNLVEARIPDWRVHRQWLRDHGNGLYAYG